MAAFRATLAVLAVLMTKLLASTVPGGVDSREEAMNLEASPLDAEKPFNPDVVEHKPSPADVPQPTAAPSPAHEESADAADPWKVSSGAESMGRPLLRPKVALRAMRPWSFTATVGPVALGSALAFKFKDVFSLPRFLLTLVTTLGVHAAGNLMNTLFDYQKGVDSPTSSDLTLVKGVLLPDQVSKLIFWCYGVALAAATPLLALPSSAAALVGSLLVAGSASAFVYTGGPGLKYKALGDILISATFGPLLVGFAFLTQAHSLGWQPLVASLPITLHIEAILHANNARDVEEDARNGVHTLAARLGAQRSLWLYMALIGVPFLAPLYTGVHHSVVGLLPLLVLPKAMDLVGAFNGKELARLPMRTAKFQFTFAVLYVATVLIPSPSLASLILSASRALGIAI